MLPPLHSYDDASDAMLMRRCCRCRLFYAYFYFSMRYDDVAIFALMRRYLRLPCHGALILCVVYFYDINAR